MNIKKIAILGSGSMGSAILAGLIKSGFAAENIAVSTRSTSSAASLAEKYGVHTFATESTDDANAKAVAGADVILVAVKPAYVVEVLTGAASAISADALVISVAAGITTKTIEDSLPASVAVIRAMPNTPAIVGRAVTGIAKGARASVQNLQIAEQLFSTVGKNVVVEESQIDALSTISGSGPAYVFFLIEQLTKAAEQKGFNASDAALLVNETFLGAVELLEASGKRPEELRRQVTSPNGTTMQAIARMESADLDRLFIEATDAALARAREIAAGK